MNALLAYGKHIPVPGLTIISPGQEPWAKLSPADYRLRNTSWVRQIIVHTTKGQWPQHVKPGAGPPGKNKIVADFWRGDPNHSAAHLVVDLNGDVVCLGDLGRLCCYHATVSNDWSVGIEMYQLNDGGIHQATLDATVLLVEALCRIFGIQYQTHCGPYHNAPLPAMVYGGKDCVGVFGHRDNTNNRGAGDPGDIIFQMMSDRGCEQFDFLMRQDKTVWKDRQRGFNVNSGAMLNVDGVPGPGTVKAIKQYHNRPSGVWALPG